MLRYKEIDQRVTTVARWYARRSSSLTFDDLYQQGWVVALEVEHEWKGSDEGAFLGCVYVSVKRQLSRYYWESVSPVSRSHSERVKAHAEMLDTDSLQANDTPESELLRARATAELEGLRSSILERFRSLYVRTVPGESWTNTAEAAALVLLGGTSPRDAAKQHGIDNIRAVYEATNVVKRALIRDNITQRLLSELQERQAYLD